VIEGCPVDIDSDSCGDLHPLPNGDFAWSGEYVVAGQSPLRWKVVVNPDPVIFATLMVTNISSLTQVMSMTVAIPAAAIPATFCAASVIGTLLDGNGDGAALSMVPGTSGFTGSIDSRPFLTLLDSTFLTVAPPGGLAPFGPVSLGLPGPTLAGPPLTMDMRVSLEFLLTPGDTLVVTGTFVVVP